MSTKIDKLWELLKQPSTHKGLIAIAGVVGVIVTPEYMEAIGAVSVLAYGMYQIFRDEDKQIKSTK
jgi:Mn2+/Fe2+ NRAMP family transporter